jgi:hypothetical protein
VHSLVHEGAAAAEPQSNIAKAERFDYRQIISSEVVPFLLSLKAREGPIGAAQVEAASTARGQPAAVDKVQALWAQQLLRDAQLQTPGNFGIAWERLLHARRMSRRIRTLL